MESKGAFWDQLKSILYLVVFLVTAISMFWYFWKFYRPKIAISKCSDAAYGSSSSYERNNLSTDNFVTYEELLDQCLTDFGVNAQEAYDTPSISKLISTLTKTDF